MCEKGADGRAVDRRPFAWGLFCSGCTQRESALLDCELNQAQHSKE